MRSTRRAGVIGAGAFGRYHATKYARTPGVTLAAVADLSHEVRSRISGELNVPAFDDWHDLIGRVDFVSVCSPASTHAEIVREFLSAGVHVLVEKPIATNLAEAEELIALADANDLVLTVGHQERFVFAKSGLLDYPDAPLSLECIRTGPWTGRGTDVSVVLDLMIHDLDLVHCLVPGDIADIEARGRSLRGRLRDEVVANLRFANGCEGTLYASRAADHRKRTLKATYPDGVIEIDFMTRQVRNTTRRVLKPLELSDPLGESVASFIAAVADGAHALVRPEQARRALETALLIEDAAAPAQGTQALHAPALTA